MIDAFVTIKCGDKFTNEYVLNLHASIRRHCTKDIPFYCITDDPFHRDLWPVMTIPLVENGLQGWWNKMVLFDKQYDLPSRIMWIDLDTVIIGNIDFLLDYNGSLMMLRDFYHEKSFASGLMIIDRPAYAGWVWYEFEKNQDKYLSMGGDQNALEAIFQAEKIRPDTFQARWPGKVISYKAHCCEGDFFKGIPEGARIVCFHGRPMPHEIKDKEWMRTHWTV
jgi:hypothetical protein